MKLCVGLGISVRSLDESQCRRPNRIISQSDQLQETVNCRQITGSSTLHGLDCCKIARLALDLMFRA